MSHLFLTAKHQQIIFKNVGSRFVWKIHATISNGPHVVYLLEAARRLPRRLQRRPYPKKLKFKLKYHKLRYNRNIRLTNNHPRIVINVVVMVTLPEIVEYLHIFQKYINNYKNYVINIKYHMQFLSRLHSSQMLRTIQSQRLMKIRIQKSLYYIAPQLIQY